MRYKGKSNRLKRFILLGAGLIPTLNTFGLVEIGVMILLVLVAAGVGMFIHAGLSLESIEESL